MKKLLSAVLSVLMISSSLFAGAISAEITETAEETAENTQTVSQAAPAEEKIIPGINLLTGTTSKYDFEDGNITSLISPAIGKDASLYYATVSNGICILYNSGVEAKHYANLKLNLTNTVPAGRKLAVVADTYGESSDGKIFSDLNFAYVGGTLNKGRNAADKSDNRKTVWFVQDASESDYKLNNGLGTFLQYGGHTEIGETYYFDNVGVYPLYKVNYYGADNATVIATDWVLLNSKGELLDAFEPSLPSDVATPEKSGFGLAGWSQTPGSDVCESSVALENKDIDLYPVFGKTQPGAGSPGINLLTGNADVLDFDTNELSSDKVDVTTQGMFAVENIGGNNVLKAYGKGYPILFANTQITKERPIYYKLKALKYIPSDVTGENTNTLVAGLVQTKGSGTRITTAGTGLTTTDKIPTSVSELKTVSAVTAKSDKYDSVGADVRLYPEIQIQKITNTDSVCVYFDDIGMYPYYKATYHLDADNTADSYFLLDDNGKFLTEYTPVLPEGSTVTAPDGKKLIGWSTQENSDTAENTVALENTDIELYPVFADADYAPHWYNDAADVKEVTDIRVQKDDGGNVINDKSGLRFKSYITDENKLDAALTEYGFIVALTEKLGQSELTHNFTYDGLAEGKKAFIAQSSYVKGTQTDLYLKYDADNALTVFSCVLVNIPVSHYNDSFTVRAYSKVNGEYVYGSAMSVSILDILNYLSENGNEVQKANAEILLAKYNASLGA